MTPGSLGQVALFVRLPEHWQVHEAWSNEQLSAVAEMSPAVRNLLDVRTQLDPEPVLTAAMKVAVVGPTEELLSVLMATLNIYVFQERAPAKQAVGTFRTDPVTRHVHVTDDIDVRIYEQTYVVRAQQSSTVAVLIFTTPNLPLVDSMAAHFALIAATATFRTDA